MKAMAGSSTAAGETASETCLDVRRVLKPGQGAQYHAQMEWWSMTNSHKRSCFADGDTWTCVTQGWIVIGNTAVVRAFMSGDIAGIKEGCANSEGRARVRRFWYA